MITDIGSGISTRFVGADDFALTRVMLMEVFIHFVGYESRPKLGTLAILCER